MLTRTWSTAAVLGPKEGVLQPSCHSHTHQHHSSRTQFRLSTSRSISCKPAAAAATSPQAPGTQPAAAAAPDRRFEELSAWLGARGGSVGSITAGDCQMGPVVVRGLVATQDLSPSTPILSVPISATLQDTRAPPPYPGAPWNVSLAAQLLSEVRAGQASPHAPYLATLPTSCCSPLLLQAQQLGEVQYAPAVEAIAAFQQTAREAYDALQQHQGQQGQGRWEQQQGQQQGQQGQQQGQGCSWEEWVWALHMVQSRSIRLAQMGCKVMIPGIDLLNHGGAAANGQLVLGKASWQLEGEPAVCFVTTQHIAAGQQVLWSYGTRGNDDFFAYHGFVLPANPHEDVVLFSGVGALLGWALQHLPQLQGLRGQQQQLEAVAEAAAYAAAQEAAALCSSAAIPGTSSSLLAPAAALATSADQQQQQSAQRQEAGALQDSAQQQQQEQRQERWSAQLNGNSSSSGRSWRSSSGSSGSGGQLEGGVLSALRGVQLHRRLASFRLHSPEWGASSCPPSATELVLRQDGCMDVRVPAVLAALMDQAAAAADGSSGGSSGQLSAALDDLVRSRCQQLLQQMPTSVQQDQELLLQLEQQGQEGDGGLMSAVVQYRLAKKQLLHQFVASGLSQQ